MWNYNFLDNLWLFNLLTAFNFKNSNTYKFLILDWKHSFRISFFEPSCFACGLCYATSPNSYEVTWLMMLSYFITQYFNCIKNILFGFLLACAHVHCKGKKKIEIAWKKGNVSLCWSGGIFVLNRPLISLVK